MEARVEGEVGRRYWEDGREGKLCSGYENIKQKNKNKSKLRE